MSGGRGEARRVSGGGARIDGQVETQWISPVCTLFPPNARPLRHLCTGNVYLCHFCDPAGNGEVAGAGTPNGGGTPYTSTKESPVLSGPVFSAFWRLRGAACRASGDNAPGESVALAFDGGWCQEEKGEGLLGGRQ